MDGFSCEDLEDLDESSRLDRLDRGGQCFAFSSAGESGLCACCVSKRSEGIGARIRPLIGSWFLKHSTYGDIDEKAGVAATTKLSSVEYVDKAEARLFSLIFFQGALAFHLRPSPLSSPHFSSTLVSPSSPPLSSDSVVCFKLPLLETLDKYAHKHTPTHSLFPSHTDLSISALCHGKENGRIK